MNAYHHFPQAQCNAIGKRYSVGEFCTFPAIDATRRTLLKLADTVSQVDEEELQHRCDAERDSQFVIIDDYATGTLMPHTDEMDFADHCTTTTSL